LSERMPRVLVTGMSGTGKCATATAEIDTTRPLREVVDAVETLALGGKSRGN
jgi:hypothetical protein